jgi:2-polyprenyl-6-methoxyphenol hydroxylase-like FAD-dependent oxidoreductase
MRSVEVIVIGGGIGGLALALALQGADRSVVVCERAPELKEVGAGILLTPNRIIQLENPVLWRLRNLAVKLTPDLLGQLALAPVFNFRG